MKWPGWSEKKNPFGKGFTTESRNRMVSGSQMLLPYFKKYYKKMGVAILEYGPFFNPLITPKRFSDKKIFFWERRAKVRKHIIEEYGKNLTPLAASFTTFKPSSLEKLKKRTQIALKEKGVADLKFDSVIASQCFNYMDYKAFLKFVTKFCNKDTLLFVNNAAGLGVAKKIFKKRF